MAKAAVGFKQSLSLLLLAAVALGGCSRGAVVAHLVGGQNHDQLSGRLVMPPGVALTGADGCAPDTAALYATGSRIGVDAPLLTTPLDASGHFVFHGLSSLEGAAAVDSRHVVTISGCGTFSARIVTGYAEQDVTSGSTLVAYAPALFGSGVPADASTANLAALMAALSQASSPAAAYDQLTGDAAMRADFQAVFGFPPERLTQAPPTFVGLTASTTAEERRPAVFAAAATHWSPAYKVAYLWKDGSSVASKAANYTYTPSGNAQGTHAVTLYVGQAAAGSDDLDTSAPYLTWAGSLQVADTLPATPPVFAVTNGQKVGTALYTTSRDLSLTLTTGEMLGNCETFSALALTENVTAAPLDAAAYTLKCTQNGTQTLSYTLHSAGDGEKTLRLWALDATGNVSQMSTAQTVILDTAAPAFTSLALAGDAADGFLNAKERAEPHALVAAASGSGFDAAGYRLVAANAACDDSLTYAVDVPKNDAGGFGADGLYKVCVKLTDLAGHAPAFGASPTFTLKTTYPVFTSASLGGAAADGFVNAAEHLAPTSVFGALVATDAAQVGYRLVPAALGCSEALVYGAAPLSNSSDFGADGDYKVCLELTDTAGNKSYGASPTIKLKTSLPGSFAATAPARYAASATPTVTWSAAAGAATYDLKVAAASGCASPLATYAGLTTTTQALTTLSDGDYYACLTAKDTAGNPRDAASYLFTVDTAAPGAFSVTAVASLTANPTPALSWGAAAGAAAYDLTVASAADCSGGVQTYTGLTATTKTPAALADGTYYVCVSAKDNAGNTTAASNNGAVSFTVDQTAPTVSLTSLTGGQFVKGGATTAVTWTASDAHLSATPVAVELSTDSGSTWSALDAAHANNGSYAWGAAVADGATYRVRVTVTDQAGNAKTVASSSDFTVDQTAPVIGSFVLAGGIHDVALPTVAVAIAASDNLSQTAAMRLSENAVFADNGWTPYAATTTFTLSQVAGDKTVYLWVKDGAGNVSTAASAQLNLDFGTPPTVSLTTPDGSTTYGVGDDVDISWSCQASRGLAASPITLQYSIDDGDTFATIAADLPNNLTATTGDYHWTLPGAVAGVPIRLLVSCKSLAGVVASAYSPFINTTGWSLFMGDPWKDLKNVSASIANVGGTTRSSVTADSLNNIYYVKGSTGIMRIDATTGYVTAFAGDSNQGGCSMTTGSNALTTLMSQISILGTDTTRTALLVLVHGCGKILRISTVDSSVTEMASFTMGEMLGYSYFLTKDRHLIFDDPTKFYILDLRTPGNSPVVIQGNGTCTTAPLTAGMDARVSPRYSMYEGTCVYWAPTIFANADASKIWLNEYYTSNGYRLDLAGDHYVIGQVDTGWNYSGQYCSATDFDNKVYCNPPASSRVIYPFDPGSETWLAPSTLPFYNNDDAGNMALGSMSDKLLAIYSLNSIQTVQPNFGGTWQYTTIAGVPLSIMGNGGAPGGVGFDHPVDIDYNAATQVLYVRNLGGHLRRVDFSATPYATSTLFHPGIWTGWGSTAVNKAGDRFSMLTSCARLYYFNFSMTASAITQQPSFLGGPCDGSGTYPPVSGTNANDGTAYFGGNNLPGWQRPLYHSNGKLYFASYSSTGDVFVMESDTNVLNRIAGVIGAGGYNAADEGQPALGAQLSNVQQLQEDANGDILIWDSTRLRRITLTTEAAQPKIYTVIDYTTVAGYSGGGNWNDAYYDESTGYTYYTTVNSEVHKAKVGVGDTKYLFTGTTLSGSIRIAKTPAGLLVLQPSRSRILKVAP